MVEYYVDTCISQKIYHGGTLFYIMSFLNALYRIYVYTAVHRFSLNKVWFAKKNAVVIWYEIIYSRQSQEGSTYQVHAHVWWPIPF